MGDNMLFDYFLKNIFTSESAEKGFNSFFKTKPLSSIFELDAFDSASGYFRSPERFKAVYELNPRIGIDEASVKILTESLSHAVSDDVSINIHLLSSGQIQQPLDMYLARRGFSPLAQKRADFFKKSSRSNNVSKGFCIWHLIITLDACSANVLAQAESTLISALESSSLNPIKSGPQKLLDLYHKIYTNISPQVSPFKYCDKTPLSEQLSSAEMSFQVEPDHLNWGNIKTRTLFADKLPDEFSLAHTFSFIGNSDKAAMQIGKPMIISWCLFTPAQESSFRNYAVSELRWKRQINSPMASFIPKLHETASEFSSLRNDLNSGSKLVCTALIATIFCEEEALDIETNKLKNYFSSIQFSLVSPKIIQLPLFLCHLPGFFDAIWGQDLKGFGVFKTLTAEQAAQFMPLQGEWTGSYEPQALLVNRQGGICFFDPFDKGADKGNFNISITGKSGSGKSNFMAYLVLERLLTGGQCFIIDVGYSYQKLGKKMGAKFVDFSKESSISLNPFFLLENLDDDSLLYLKPLISKMCFRKRETSELEDTLIEKAIRLSWAKKGRHCTLKTIEETLCDIGAVELAQAIYPFAQGVYADYFNRPKSINFNSDFIIFELEELKDKPDLQEIVMLTLIFKIQSAMYKNRHRKKYLVVDEAWQLLGGQNTSASAGFLENIARRIRKFNGSLIVGTQGLDDFFTNKCGEAIFYNSDWLISLAQKEDALDRALSKSSGLKKCITQLKSVRTKSGHYSEALIKSQAGYVVLRLYLNPELLELFSTDAEKIQVDSL